ncbi:MAG: methyltransferase regulatory domain-containing protein [Campylobacter sp.]|nr:methyltransferase regulatory domain-containing protein [Campylobacter sp.]
MSDLGDKIDNFCEEKTHISAAYSGSSPLKLEACATLLGLNPVTSKNAKILEIGCSFGGNIIPFALNNPDAQILGIDINLEQIKKAKEASKEIGLKNIEFKHIDVRKISEKDIKKYEKFDYIIAHAIYSWVSQDTQKAVIEVIKNFLAPQGVAFVSYNVYPGWKIKDMLRDLILFSTRNCQNTEEKIAKAKESISVFKHFLLDSENIHVPSDTIINFINQIFLINSDDYIAHEFLGEINSPCYFKEFVENLEKNELSYLCESSLDDIFASVGNADVNAYMLKNFPNRYDQEQFMDFYMHRVFRQSLIVHKQAYEKVAAREINPSDIAKLNFVARFRNQNDIWLNRHEEKMSESSSWLCDVLSKIYPQSTNLTQIFAFVDEKKRLGIYESLVNLFSTNSLNFSLCECENIAYEVGKTRLKPQFIPYIKYFLNNPDANISFADKFNHNMKFSDLDAYIALKFDGKNKADDILEDSLKFIKKNKKAIFVNGKEVKGDKLRKYTLNRIIQTEFTLRECYFFERL